MKLRRAKCAKKKDAIVALNFMYVVMSNFKQFYLFIIKVPHNHGRINDLFNLLTVYYYWRVQAMVPGPTVASAQFDNGQAFA